MKGKMNFENELALITGASSGIGYEMAKELASRGCNLVLVSNEKEKLLTIKGEFERDYHITVNQLCMDLARQNAAEELYEACKTQGLQVSILISNAGMFFFGQTVKTDVTRGKMLLNLHVVTPSILSVLFGRGMKERRHGYIAFMSSISAYKDFPGISFYGSTKRYLMSFAKSLRSEMKEYGVSVTCICPGATATNLYNAAKAPVNLDLALKTGIMMRPDKVARKGLNALFHKKATYIPGIINKIMVLIAVLTPQFLIDFINTRTKFLKD
jgi:short-subunit dehydrogenase